MSLEEKILVAFNKYMGEEVKGLDLIISICPDCWPDYEGTYSCEVMEKQDNGKVWNVECTKFGKIKDCIEL